MSRLLDDLVDQFINHPIAMGLLLLWIVFVFVVNIYACVQRKQDFGMIKNAFIRVVDSAKNEELVYFNLSEDHSGATALFAGEIYRDGNEWKFSATGDATRDTGLGEIANKYTK